MSQIGNNITRSIQTFLHDAQRSPSFMVRILVVYFTVFVILLPDLLAMLLLLSDVFAENSGVDLYSAFFKGIVIMVVFVFGIFIMAAASHNEPRLEYTFLVIGLILVMVAVGVLGIISNRCIPDLQCDPGKYGLGILVVTGLTGLGTVLPLAVRKSPVYFALPFLVIAVYQSLLLLLTIVSNYNIRPTTDAFRSLFLLIYSVVWLIIFGYGARRRT